MKPLKERIQDAQNQYRPAPTEKTLFKKSPLGVSVELVSGIIVGTGIGYFLDINFRASPWFLIGGFILGSLSGLYNIYRYTKAMKEKM
tara:strand:+ start:485 stop:748 length:264 start_codon:yes stop_codon:yes gene_type:complete